MELQEANSSVTISGLIVSKIEKIKSNYSTQLNSLPTPTVDSVKKPDVDLKSLLTGAACLSDTWTGEFFSTQWVTARTIIIENINKLVVKAKEAVDQIIHVLPNQLINVLIVKLLDIIEEFIITTVQPLDAILQEITYKYNTVIRMWRSLKKTATDVKAGLKSEEYKKAQLKKIIDYLSTLDENIAFLISLTFLIDSINEMLDDLKEMFKTEKGAWNRLVDKFKDQYSMLKELTNKFGQNGTIGTLYKLVAVLLPIIAGIAAALLCSNKTDMKIRKAAANVRDEELKLNGINPDDLSGEEEQKKLEDLYRNLSEILEYALKDIYGYSMKYDASGNLLNDDASNNIATEEIISVCQVENLSDELGEQFDDRPIRYVLEFGKDLIGAYFTVDINNSISNDQIIGYYQGIPIKSMVSGVVIDRKSRHIIVENKTTLDTVVDECQNVADNLDFTDRFSPIVDKFKKRINLETYLNDYALQCRLPNLVLHSKGKGTYKFNLIEWLKGNDKNSKYKLIDDYTAAVDDVVNNYKYKIKDICSADNVKTSCENRQNDQLKNKIVDAKKQGIENIIQFYNRWITMTNNYCADEDDTYMLVADYINYLSSDSFIYDDDNEYIVEQFNAISDFIKDRMSLEKVDKNSLIKEFNNRCNDLLAGKLNTSNYYSYFSNLFGSDWYVQDADNIIGISEYQKKTDENYDSLYKKMYNHILNLIGSTTLSRDTKTFDVENVTDINAFLKDNNSGSSFDNDEQKTIANQNKAKAITKYFMMIRNTSKYSSYRSSGDLKSKTRNEARILDDITNRVIAEYRKPENLNFYDDDNLSKMFDEFKRVECPYQGTIYINNYQHEHYVYSYMADTQMNLYNMNATDDELMDRLSSKTAHTPFKLPYWLIYCAEATLVNVLVPLYWSTGLIIMGAPILLPIIYLPIYFLGGSVSVLFGLGICGIAIWPMLVFINNTAYSSTVLLPITLAVDFIKKKLKEIGGMSVKSLAVASKPMISACDEEIYQIEEELKKLKVDISNYKNIMAGVDITKMNGIELPSLSSQNSLSSIIGEVFNNALKQNVNKLNLSSPIVYQNNNENVAEIRSEDGLYHNVAVILDAATGTSSNENKSPFTANKTYPSGWDTKKNNDEILDFSEQKWSKEICKQIKSMLKEKGIDVYMSNNKFAQSMTSDKHHIMLSIRVNSLDPDDKKWKSGINGWSIYTSSPYDGNNYYKDSVALSELIYDNAIIKFRSNNMNLLTKLNGNWRPDKNDYYKKLNIRHQEEDYSILNNSNMPVVLSKNFYCDNIDDLKYLNSAAGKMDIASVHVNGILQFISYKGWS